MQVVCQARRVPAEKKFFELKVSFLEIYNEYKHAKKNVNFEKASVESKRLLEK
jgi:hypothetical protein